MGNTGPVSAACTAPARTGHSHGPIVEETSYKPRRSASVPSDSPGSPTRELRGGDARARSGYHLTGMQHKNRQRLPGARMLGPTHGEGSVRPFFARGRETANNHDPHATHPLTRSANTATPEEPRPAHHGGASKRKAPRETNQRREAGSPTPT
ncbi:hypothetical protein PIB30_109255, partial [Stylosanthes scabra]|nr:hypothetical protein [Stylosanthes scabra]